MGRPGGSPPRKAADPPPGGGLGPRLARAAVAGPDGTGPGLVSRRSVDGLCDVMFQARRPAAAVGKSWKGSRQRLNLGNR
jgi:hypothetical protein